MQESNLVHCKVCGKLKTRIEDGKYRRSKDKRFIDENKKLWNGRSTCPQCHVIKIRENMRKLRFQRSLEKKDGTEIT